MGYFEDEGTEQSSRKSSSAWPVSPCVPLSAAPVRSPRAFRARRAAVRAARRELVWAKKQKHEDTPRAHTVERTGTTKKREKKKSRDGATRPACFRGIPRCCWQTPFFGAVRLPRARPFLVSFSVPRGGPISRLFLLHSCSGILARSAPSRAADFSFLLLCFLSLLLLHPSSSPRTPGPSISSPTVPRYPEERKRKGNEKQGIEKRRKTSGAPASQRNVKLGYVKTGGGDFH